MSEIISIEAYKANKILEEELNQSAVEGFDLFRILKKIQADYREGEGLPIIGEEE